jgi:hypothetical protein
MPLLTPILDDRTYQQLRDELVGRIPVYTPEWTDLHPGDPGIALLELLASLGEHVLFKFNQLPDAARMAFLRLLDVPLDPAGVAQGMVQFTVKGKDPVEILVPQDSTVRAGKVIYTTSTEVVAQPIEMIAATRMSAPLPTDEEFRARAEAAVQALALTGEQTPAYYEVRTLAADTTDPTAQPLDPAESVDGALWLAILRRENDDVAPDLRGRLFMIGYQPDSDIPAMTDVDACPGDGAGPPSPPLVWRITAPGNGSDPVRYVTVKVLGDTTAALTKMGAITLSLPDDVGMNVPDDPALKGTGDLPPTFEDDRDDRIIAWLQATRPDEVVTPIVRVGWIGVNASPVIQEQVASAELLGIGTAEAGQRYRLVHPGTRPSSVALDVEEAGSWVRWEEIDDLSASPAGRHFQLDAESGEIRFGDGIRGRAPQIGERIRVLSYRYGGGIEGNVAPKAIGKCDVAGVDVVNPWPTSGGSEPEELADAIERIPAELRRRDRAVTRGDFAELAMRTPGAELARAECLPLFDPHAPTVERPGAVSVVVWPQRDRRHPSAPRPDRATLSSICRYLDERRLVTTELFVIPPTYRRIAVAVGVHVKPDHGIEAVRRWVELVLRQYLAPVPPYGPEGQGWPLGRRVHGPELEAAALQVDGVEYLEGLRISVEGTGPNGPTWQERDNPPTVELEPYEVPQLAAITVVTGPPLPPGAELEPPSDPRVPVPIPVPRLVC